jgi:hypothetical protein
MTSVDQPPDLYHVHLFAVVRVKISNVEATSERDAIARAREQAPDLYERFDAPDGEFTEEFSQFLVDVVGDADYDQSRWFHSTENPLLSILDSLVRWYHAEPRDAARLDQIVAEAREAIETSE